MIVSMLISLPPQPFGGGNLISFPPPPPCRWRDASQGRGVMAEYNELKSKHPSQNTQDPAYPLRLPSPTPSHGRRAPAPPAHAHLTADSPPRTHPPGSEHARAVWRQFRTAAAGAYHGFSGRRASALLGSGMIGQKTLYSFFSPCPAGKRRARSPEPAHPGTGVAAEAEESGNAAVRSGGDRAPGTRDGEEGDGPRSAEGLQGRASDLVSWVPMFKADCTCSKQPAQFSVGGHSEEPANGDGSRGPRRQSEGEGPPCSARRPIRGERGRTHPLPEVFAAKRPRGDAGGAGRRGQGLPSRQSRGRHRGRSPPPLFPQPLGTKLKTGAAACLPGPDPQSPVLLRLAPWGLQSREWACSAMGRGVGGDSCGRLGAARCRR